MFTLEINTRNQDTAQNDSDVQNPVGNLGRLEQIGQDNCQDDGQETHLQVLGAQLGIYSAEYGGRIYLKPALMKGGN